MRIFLLIGVMTCHVGIFNVMANSELQEALKSVNDFSNLYVKYITERETENWACSPLGGFLSLSMAAYAARGQIQDQLRSMIDLPTDDKLVKARINFLVKKFKSRKSIFRSAMQMFISENCNTSAAFDEAYKDIFRSEAHTIDLNDSYEVDIAMSRWYTRNTDYRIRQPKTLPIRDSRIAVVLVNAARIEGQWLHRFKVKRTNSSSTFYLKSDSDTKVPIMFQTNEFKFGEIPDVNGMFLELPYKVKEGGDAASMVILRPNEIDGLDDMERNLENVDFDELLRAEPRKVTVGMPKFSFSHGLHYTKIYEKAMLEDMLIPGPKFDSTTDEIHVMGAQLINLDVSEDGSGAEFSTDFGTLIRRELAPTEDQFIVDRPFIVVVVESGVKLIYARIMDPSQYDTLSNDLRER